MPKTIKKLLESCFNEFYSKHDIPTPDDNLKNRLYSTIPQKTKSYQFFTRNKIKIAFGIAIVCTILVLLITTDRNKFKTTRKIVIKDKMDPDHFKPTKVVTITKADQIH